MAEQRVTIRLTAENAPLIAGLRESSAGMRTLQDDVQSLDRSLSRLDGRTVRIRAELDRAALETQLQQVERGNAPINLRVHATFEDGTRERLQAILAAFRLDLPVNVDTAAAEAALAALARDRRVSIRPEIDATAARGALDGLTRTRNANIRPSVDGSFLAGVRTKIDAALADLPPARVSIDTAPADRRIEALKLELANIRDTQLGVNLDPAPALLRIKEISAEIHALNGESARLDVRADTASATAKLAEIQAEVDRLNGQNVDVKAKVDTPGLGALGGNPLGGVATSGAALISLLPQAVSLLSAAAAEGTALAGQLGLAASSGAGLVPILGSMAQGLGVLVAGTSGVRAAFKAFTSEQDAGTSTQASAIRAAANTLVSARESVATATQNASRSVQSALLSETSAERSLGDAQQAELKAQQGLSDARKQAKLDLEDLAAQVSGGALSERADVLALQDAQQALAQTPQGGEAFAKAQLAVDQATQSLADQRRENARLADQQAQANAAGVDGAKNVVAAQDQVTASVRAEGDARQAVSQAAVQVQQAQVDGARSVADAQRSLAQAQAAYADATTKTSSTVSKLDEALAKLGPNQRAFVQTAIDAKDAYTGLKEAIGENLFAGLDTSLKQVTTGILPLFQSQLGDTATILNRTGRSLVDQLVGPLKGPLADALKLNNDLILKGSPILGHLASIFLDLYNAAGPLAKRIVDGAEHLVDFADGAAKAGAESGRLTGFFDRAGDRAANLLHGLGNLATGMFNVFKIGNEGSAGLLPGFEKLTQRFEDFTTSVGGDTKIRAWFLQGREAGTAFVGLLGDLRQAFTGLTSNTSAAGFITDLRSLVPYLGELVHTLSDDGGNGHLLAQGLLEIAQSLDRINAGGLLTTFVTTLSSMVTGISNAVRDVPGLAPLLSGLAAAAGGLLAIKLVVGPVLGLASALKGLYSTVAGASSLNLALGGIGAVLVAGTLAWGAYSQEVNHSKEAIKGVDDALRGGVSSDLDKQTKTLQDLNGQTEDLFQRTKDRGFFGGIIHPLDNVKVIADGFNGTLGKQKAALAEAQTAQVNYTSALDAALAVYNSTHASQITYAQGLDLAEAAQVKVGDSSATITQKIADYQSKTGSAATATTGLAKDMDTLRDSTSSAADKADALKRILDSYGGGARDAQAATIAYQKSVQDAADTIAGNSKGLNDNTAAGRANGQALLDQKQALDDQLASAVKAGAGQDELRKLLDQGTDALGKNLTATHGTADEVAHYQEILGLTPDEKTTLFNALTDQASKKITDLGTLMTNVGKNYDATITVGVNGTSGSAFSQSLQSKLANADGNLLERRFADGGLLPTIGSQQPQIQGNHGPAGIMWAETGAGPWEAFVSGAPEKRDRSRAIASETVSRLGGVAQFADGGMFNITANAPMQGVGQGIAAAFMQVAQALSASGGSGSSVVDFAIQQIGKYDYSWGGGGPNGPSTGIGSGAHTVGFDCSGFAEYVYSHFGYKPGGDSRAQHAWAKPSPDQPGALAFFGNPVHHVGVSRGDGTMVDAAHTGTKIRIDKLFSDLIGFGVPSQGFGSSASASGKGAEYAYDNGKASDSSGGVERWRGLVDQTLGELGLAKGLDNKVLGQIKFESSGNPNAVQGNIGDINNRTGDLAHGLMQVIGATFERWRNPALPDNRFDPHANIYAGINYDAHKFGGNPTLRDLDQGLGYADGGIRAPLGSVLNPHIRDAGGPLLQGFTFNGTGAPEPVEYVRGPAGRMGAPGTVQTAPAPSGGTFTGTLTLSSGEFLGVVDGRIDHAVNASLAHG